MVLVAANLAEVDLHDLPDFVPNKLDPLDVEVIDLNQLLKAENPQVALVGQLLPNNRQGGESKCETL